MFRALCAICTGGLAAAAALAGPTETVEVTATRLAQPQQAVAGTVTVITQDALEQSIAMDLADVLRHEPGLAEQAARRGGHQGFVIRGLGGNRVLTLIDGIRSNDHYDAAVSAYGKNLYTLDTLDTVEVLRGPASALWGADALGGVVLLRSPDPHDQARLGLPHRLRWQEDGADDGRRVSLASAWAAGPWALALHAGERRYAAAEDTPSADPLDGRRRNALLSAGWRAAGGEMRLRLDVERFEANEDIRLDSALGPTVFAAEGHDEAERERLSLRAEGRDQGLFARWALLVYTQRSRQWQRTVDTRIGYSFIDPLDPATYGGTTVRRESAFGFHQDNRGLRLDLTHTFSALGGDHRLQWGLDLDESDNRRPRDRCETALADGRRTCAIAAYPFAPPEVFPNRVFPDTETRRGGLFVQDEYRLGAWTALLGMRLDRYRMRVLDDAGLETIGTPPPERYSARERTDHLALSRALGAGLRVYLQYAEGFRPPNYEEANQAFVNRAYGYALLPNPTLQAETSRGWELGLKGHGEALDWSLALYRQDFDDFIDTQPAGMQDGLLLFQDMNIGRVRLQGVEGQAAWRFAEVWRLDAALAWSRGDDRSAGAPLDATLPPQLGLGLAREGARFAWRAQASRHARAQRVSAPDRTRGTAYTLLDLIGEARLGDHWRLRAGVYNALDERYAPWPAIAGLAADDMAALEAAEAPGRHLRLALEVAF